MNFPTSDYDSVVIYMGVESSSAVITQASTVVATFDLGVPITESDSAPTLRFDSTISYDSYKAYGNSVTLSNA